jgi:hypothetical protein
MNFFTKLAISAITIGFTIFGGIYTGFEKIDNRMDSKVEKGKKEVLSIVTLVQNENIAAIKAQDDKVTVQLVSINGEISEARKDIRSLLGIARRRQVFVKTEIPTYTIKESISQGNRL